MEKNNVFAYDLKGNDYGTQKSIEFKLKEALTLKERDLQIAIAKRDSMVGLRDYVNTYQSSKMNSIAMIEEIKEEDSESCNDNLEEQSQNSDLTFGNIEKIATKHTSWFKNTRRLSYSEIHKKNFIMKLSEEETYQVESNK